MTQGKAIIFSAPSGSGKTSLVKHLIQTIPNLGFSISACTRDKRGRHEVHGKDYYFLSQEEFIKKIDEDAFIEWEEVYAGNFYGTLKEEIQRIWDSGKAVIFDVDVKEESLSRRLFKAEFESKFEPQFDVTVINDEFAKSSAEAEYLVNEFLAR